MRPHFRYLISLLFIMIIGVCPGAYAQFPGVKFTPVATGLVTPIHIANAGDGSGRLFIVEQGGTVRILSNGSLLPTPFINLAGRIVAGGEQGLLSIVFPPQPPLDHFYVNYTRLSDGATVISRFLISANPNVADSTSEQVLLVIAQPFANHNGGMMAFGPDGFLYIGTGDGGSGGDPNNFAQNVTPLPGNDHLLGKLLRIDVESGATPYAIPATNPTLGGLRNEIWARGLRNPWKFSFDRLTGDLYIGDVGQNTMEEIDFRLAGTGRGANYGWRILEGNLCFNPAIGCIAPPRYVPPVARYTHALGCSVTGGYVYRGTEFAVLPGVYLYGDFCTGRIWGLRRIPTGFERGQLTDTAFSISTFGEGEDGSLYLADYGTGTIYKISETVTVVSPNGGEVVAAPSQQLITWAAAPDVDHVTLHFSTNNGAVWQLIQSNVQGTSFLWNVPVTPSATCRIRIIGVDAAGKRAGVDRSDRAFSIQ